MSEVGDLERDLLRSARLLDVPSNAAGKERARAILSLGAGSAVVALATKAKPASLVWKIASQPLWRMFFLGVVGATSVGALYATAHRSATARVEVSPGDHAVAAPLPPPPVVATEAPKVEPAPAALPLAPSPEAPPEAKVAEQNPTAPPSAHRVTPTSEAASMAAQVALFDRVTEALDGKRSAQALENLDTFERRFPSGALSQEATVLRIEALYQAGRRREGEALSDRFLADHPTSTHAEHVRQLRVLSSSGGGG
jgi:hypothetical protein